MLQTIGVIIAIVLIVTLSVRRVNFAVSIGIGSVIIGLFSGVTSGQLAGILISVFQDYSTYELLLDIALIGIIGYVMRETGLISDLIQALSKILPRKVLLALIPAIFGAMTVPGGALISAPLIEKEASELGLTADKKTFTNLLFRHIWIFILPISSPIILATRLSNVDVYKLVVLQIPSFLCMLLLGIVFLRYGISVDLKPLGGRVSHRAIVLGVAPILVVVILNMVGVWLPIALSLGISMVFLIKRDKLRSAPYLLMKGPNRDVVLATLSVIIFRYLIQETNAFHEIFTILQNIGVPDTFFLTVFPLLLGVMAAIPTSGVGIGFSLVLPMFPNISLTMVSFMYQSTIIGYLLSPLHLCVILTNEYFHSEPAPVYRLWVPYLLGTYVICLASPILMSYILG